MSAWQIVSFQVTLSGLQDNLAFMSFVSCYFSYYFVADQTSADLVLHHMVPLW